MIDLSGKIALVTGAGRGIGRGCAVELARCGAEVIINDRPDSTDLPVTAEEVRAVGGSVHAIEADVFSRPGCEQLVSEALELLGKIDILISNPAYSRRAAFLEYSPDEFERTLAGTLTSGFHMAQLVGRQMVQRGEGGKMVFISSVQGEMPNALSCAYGAAKAGLNHLTRSIAVELSVHRINVNAIAPGWIDTPGEHATFSEETIEQQSRALPWGRMGLPAEIGKAAAFLSSEAADYISGAILPVDGLFRFKDCRQSKQAPLKSNPAIRA